LAATAPELVIKWIDVFKFHHLHTSFGTNFLSVLLRMTFDNITTCFLS
jgi:hypothetical protein